MSFLEIRFPESISFESSTILEFNTSIITSKNGNEQRNVNWQYNKMKYNIINGIKTTRELDEIIKLFRNAKGQAYGFRFKDWSDYKATKQQIAIGDNINTKFQLIKTYIISNNIYTRIITKPVISTVKLYIDDVEINDFNIDFTTGEIVLSSPPQENSIIYADFEFDVPVRFNSDILEITMQSIKTGFVKDIMLIEV